MPNGSIVVVGTASNVGSSASIQLAIARFDRHRALDASFGNGGKALPEFEGGNATATSVNVLHSGKILVVGHWSNSSASGIALVRYTERGALDGSFGADGKVVSSLGTGASVPSAAALEHSGNIVVSGYDVSPSGAVGFVLARYCSEGGGPSPTNELSGRAS